jgi:hypothetical protein
MQTLFRLLFPLLLFGLFVVGCDSGGGVSTSGLGDSTSVEFVSAGDVSGEGGGTAGMEIVVSDPGFKGLPFRLDVDQAQSTATLGEDVDGLSPTTRLRFPKSATDGQTQTFSFDIVDDSITDGDEELVIALVASDTSGVSVGGQSTFTLSIKENDLLAASFADSTLAPMMPFSVASGNDWGTSSEGDPPNAPYASASGFGGNEPANDWLISPALDFNRLEGETLTFLNAKGFDDSGRRGLQVKVSTDYDGSGNPENFTWASVPEEDINFSDGNFSFVHSGEVDLSADSLQSAETYVAFQYRSSGTRGGSAATWQIDDAVVTGRVANP